VALLLKVRLLFLEIFFVVIELEYVFLTQQSEGKEHQKTKIQGERRPRVSSGTFGFFFANQIVFFYSHAFE